MFNTPSVSIYATLFGFRDLNKFMFKFFIYFLIILNYQLSKPIVFYVVYKYINFHFLKIKNSMSELSIKLKLFNSQKWYVTRKLGQKKHSWSEGNIFLSLCSTFPTRLYDIYTYQDTFLSDNYHYEKYYMRVKLPTKWIYSFIPKEVDFIRSRVVWSIISSKNCNLFTITRSIVEL